jgi:hypothetical protein
LVRKKKEADQVESRHEKQPFTIFPSSSAKMVMKMKTSRTHHHHSHHQRACSSLMVADRGTLGTTTTTIRTLLLVFLFLLSTDPVLGTEFQTWSGHQYNLEMLAASSSSSSSSSSQSCDLVLLHSNKFAAGRGIDIHIRTSRRQQGDTMDTDNDMVSSYISGVAVRIGPHDDILEVSSHGTYYLNGVLGRRRQAAGRAEETTTLQDENLAGFPIVHRSPLLENEEDRYYFYDIVVESGEEDDYHAHDDTTTNPVIIIRLTSHDDVCGVHILFGDNNNNNDNKNKIRDEYFADAVGLLGRYESSSSSVTAVGGEEMVARNGQTIMADNPSAYGMEWQVRSSSSRSSPDGDDNRSSNSSSIGNDDRNAFLDPQLFHKGNDSSQTCILASSSLSSSLPTNTGVSAAVTADDARHVRRRKS